jgi:hypothetical protein
VWEDAMKKAGPIAERLATKANHIKKALLSEGFW